jgi:hypothetical protein
MVMGMSIGAANCVGSEAVAVRHRNIIAKQMAVSIGSQIPGASNSIVEFVVVCKKDSGINSKYYMR